HTKDQAFPDPQWDRNPHAPDSAQPRKKNSCVCLFFWFFPDLLFWAFPPPPGSPSLSPQPHTQSLETLNLGHNPIGNEGVRNLKNGLISNRSVLRLGLASTKLTCEGAVAVAEFIAESPRLLRLDLRENEIKTGGLMALSLALKVNHSLLRLDLDREPKKEAVSGLPSGPRAGVAGEVALPGPCSWAGQAPLRGPPRPLARPTPPTGKELHRDAEGPACRDPERLQAQL
ncbi:protein phosphatase 1 regulatory subunit 37-like, partial [Trichechus manatus latirostris]|uniref:Protein phosphatase 1 regulatory subunit 37 n=1 Tax=Trichechus manatus latirostris TaxID=127582 RepID=A0A2Y9QIP7_TRIMA